MDWQSPHLLLHRPPLGPIANKPSPSEPFQKRHRQRLVRGYRRMRGRIPKQGVSRTRKVPGVEVTGQSSLLQYDRAVGDRLQVGQALGYVEDGHALWRWLSIRPSRRSVSGSGKAAVGSSGCWCTATMPTRRADKGELKRWRCPSTHGSPASGAKVLRRIVRPELNALPHEQLDS